MVVYGIVGGVSLALAVVFVAVLNRKPDESNLLAPLNVPIDPNAAALTAEEARLAAEAEAAAKAAAEVRNPRAEVAAIAKEIIGLARQPNIRDKALARRMSADLYLRSGEDTLGAQELNQILAVDRSKSFYRIQPHITQYWRHKSAGAEQEAQKSLEMALADRGGIPKIGRAGMESALSLASVLVAEGKIPEAQALVESRIVDKSITANRDMLASVPWFWIADHSRENLTPPLSVIDVMSWSEPLHTAVACDLALHQRWTEAITWSVSHKKPGVVAAALTEISIIAGATKAPAAVLQQISDAIPADKPVVAVQVVAAVAAATQNKTLLESAIATLEKLPVPMPVKLPTVQQIVEKYESRREDELLRAAAVAEVVRAAIVCGDTDTARSLMIRLRTELDAAAPPARGVRELSREVSKDESAARQKIASGLNTTNSASIDKAFKEYRRHLISDGGQPGLFVLSEDRRFIAIQLLSRIIRVGGAEVVRAALNDPASGWADEIMLDDLSGLLAVAALQSNQTLPEAMQPDPGLKKDGIEAGHAALAAKIAPVLISAWANRDKQLGEGLKALESGCGNELPGLRQACVNELVATTARSAKDPKEVLTQIKVLENSVWREEAYLIAGRQLAMQNLQAELKKWIESNRLPPLEQICLSYGAALVILDGIDAAQNPAPAKKQ